MTLLTYLEVADRLAVSKRTVERLVADGELAVTTVRGARRIHPDEVTSFVVRASRRDVVGTSTGPAAPLRARPRRVSSFREQLRSVA